MTVSGLREVMIAEPDSRAIFDEVTRIATQFHHCGYWGENYIAASPKDKDKDIKNTKPTQ